MEEKKECLIVVDSNSIIHRAYHALPPLATEKGEIVNAVYGFLLVFLKAIKEFQPDYIAACFDMKGPTFRHEKFKDYKAKRPPMPDNLRQQFPRVKEVLTALNIKIFEKEGFEADDIIGFVSRSALKGELSLERAVIILSGDLDTLQLINRQTKVYALRKGMKDTLLYDEGLVGEKYQGLMPNQLIDFKALRGDPSDNIIGVSGIGEKTAIELIKKFNSLENIYKEMDEKSENAGSIRPRIKELLVNQKEQAFLSKILVKIETDIPLDFNLEKCRWKDYDKENALKLLRELGFKSLLEKLP